MALSELRNFGCDYIMINITASVCGNDHNFFEQTLVPGRARPTRVGLTIVWRLYTAELLGKLLVNYSLSPRIEFVLNIWTIMVASRTN